MLEGGGYAKEVQAPALEVARLTVGALAAAHGEPEPDDPEAAVVFLLRDGPEAIPNGLPHEAIRGLSGESAAGGIVTAVRELAKGISRIVADRPYPALLGGAVR